MKSLKFFLNESLKMNEGLLSNIKNLFSKASNKAKENKSSKEMLDDGGISNIDNISDDDLMKLISIYKKSNSHYKFILDQPIDCVACLQGLYDGAYSNVDDTKYDEFGEKRLSMHMKELAKDNDAKDLINDRSSYPELMNSAKIDYIHGYVNAFSFAKFNGLSATKEKKFSYKDGVDLNKKLK